MKVQDETYGFSGLGKRSRTGSFVFFDNGEATPQKRVCDEMTTLKYDSGEKMNNFHSHFQQMENWVTDTTFREVQPVQVYHEEALCAVDELSQQNVTSCFKPVEQEEEKEEMKES